MIRASSYDGAGAPHYAEFNACDCGDTLSHPSFRTFSLVELTDIKSKYFSSGNKTHNTIGVSSIFKLIRRTVAFARMCPTFDLSCEEDSTRR